MSQSGDKGREPQLKKSHPEDRRVARNFDRGDKQQQRLNI